MSEHYDSNDLDDGTIDRCPFCRGEAIVDCQSPILRHAPWQPGTLERSEMHCSFGEYGDWVRFYITREEAEAALKGESKDV